jgi:hypothetical protein
LKQFASRGQYRASDRPQDTFISATKCFRSNAEAARNTACAPSPSGYRDGSHRLRQVAVGDDMTLIDIALWLIFIALLALLPVGCIMTRPIKKDVPQADKSA